MPDVKEILSDSDLTDELVRELERRGLVLTVRSEQMKSVLLYNRLAQEFFDLDLILRFLEGGKPELSISTDRIYQQILLDSCQPPYGIQHRHEGWSLINPVSYTHALSTIIDDVSSILTQISKQPNFVSSDKYRYWSGLLECIKLDLDRTGGSPE